MPPRETKVCHKCDTPACVNPDHLWIGSQADNVADMVAKGRQRYTARFGSTNSMAALDEDAVWAIRHMLANGYFSQVEVAVSYGVSPMTISRIANYQTWPHVHLNWPFHRINSNSMEAAR
jgi:DNA invertase Pin-like site-specific DNA recombinase